MKENKKLVTAVIAAILIITFGLTFFTSKGIIFNWFIDFLVYISLPFIPAYIAAGVNKYFLKKILSDNDFGLIYLVAWVLFSVLSALGNFASP
jgi:hypothetical protein